MTSVYTDLTKEAKLLGGPDALRAFYESRGRAAAAALASGSRSGAAGIGIAALAGAGAMWLGKEVHARVARSRTERAVPDSGQESAVEATGGPAAEGCGQPDSDR